MTLTSFIINKASIKTLIECGFNKLIVEEPHFSLLSRRYYNSSPDYKYIIDVFETVKNINPYTKVIFNLDIIPHNKDLKKIKTLVKLITKIGFDGIRIQDIGLTRYILDINPNSNIELNSVTGNYNYRAFEWIESKVPAIKTIVYSKELTHKALSHINSISSTDNELLVQGPILLLYSKRKLIEGNPELSKILISLKDKNSHYTIYLQEKKRIGKYFPLINNTHGSFLFLPETLCLIKRMDIILNTKIQSLLFDFRNNMTKKSIKDIVSTYKTQIKLINNNCKINTKKLNHQYKQIQNYYNQKLTEGFFLENNTRENIVKEKERKKMGNVISIVKEKSIAVETTSELYINDELKIITPENKALDYKIHKMTNLKGNSIEKADREDIVILNWRKGVSHRSIIYKKEND